MFSEVRIMKKHELAIMDAWALREGWDIAERDTLSFYKADPQGFFIEYVADKPVALACGVAYDEAYSFFGVYVVTPEERGKGYGWALSNRVMSYLGARNIGLDSLCDKVDLYRRAGFVEDHGSCYYEFTGQHLGAWHPNIELYSPEHHWEQIQQYDHDCFPADRTDFLQDWVERSDVCTLCYRENGVMRGYTVRRRCRQVYKLGPLFADNIEIARNLLQAAQSGLEGARIQVNVPDYQDKEQLFDGYPKKEALSTVRMYTKGRPSNVAYGKVFGITTAALG